MCCNNIIVRVLNILNVVFALALGIATAILVSVGLITSATIPTLVFILLGVVGIVGVLGLVETPVVTPIFVGVLVALFAYFIGTLIQYAYVTVDEICEDENCNRDCCCERTR